MRTVVMILISAISFFLNICIAPELAILNAKIDFIMISVVMLAFFSKKWYPPVFCALYSGITADIVTQADTFINTGIYIAVAVLTVTIVILLKENGFFISVITVAAATATKHFFLMFVLYFMRLSETFSLSTFIYGLPSIIYTGLVSAIIYFIYKKLFSFPFMREFKDEKRYL